MSISAASARRGTPVTADTPLRRRGPSPSRPNANIMRAAAVMMARGIMRLGRRDSSPSDPADSKPAKARKPAVAARVRADRPAPGGSTNTAPDQPWPAGAVPADSRQLMTPISTRMRQTDTTSNTSTDLVVGLTPRDAKSQMTAHAASASGYQSAARASPVAL